MVDQLEKPQVSRATKLWLAAAVAAFGVLFVIGAVVDGGEVGDRTPSAESRTEDALNELWLGMDTGERLDFCAEARAAGYEVVANEIAGIRFSEPREVRWWLEDRCG